MPRRLQRFCQKPLVENGDAVAYSFYLSARQEFPSSRHHNYRWRSDSGYFGVGKIHSFRYIQRHRDRHHRRRCRRLCGLGGRCQLWRNLAEEATRGEIGESGGGCQFFQGCGDYQKYGTAIRPFFYTLPRRLKICLNKKVSYGIHFLS